MQIILILFEIRTSFVMLHIIFPTHSTDVIVKFYFHKIIFSKSYIRYISLTFSDSFRTFANLVTNVMKFQNVCNAVQGSNTFNDAHFASREDDAVFVEIQARRNRFYLTASKRRNDRLLCVRSSPFVANALLSFFCSQFA